jgi:RNA polymerase sigma-54 factor
MQKHALAQQQQLKQTAAQTVQLMRLVELSTTNLEQEILKEVEENPALEIDHDAEIQEPEMVEPEFENNLDNINDYYDQDEYDSYDYRMEDNNRSKEDTHYFPTATYSTSFQENLLQQLHEYELSERDFLMAEYLIGCLDENGYLSMDAQGIVMDF